MLYSVISHRFSRAGEQEHKVKASTVSFQPAQDTQRAPNHRALMEIILVGLGLWLFCCSLSDSTIIIVQLKATGFSLKPKDTLPNSLPFTDIRVVHAAHALTQAAHKCQCLCIAPLL